MHPSEHWLSLRRLRETLQMKLIEKLMSPPNEARLFRRSESGRTKPFVDARRRLGLPNPPQQQLSGQTARQFLFGGLSENSRLFRQPLFEARLVLDPQAMLGHGNPPYQNWPSLLQCSPLPL